jgi:hypothetical protein
VQAVDNLLNLNAQYGSGNWLEIIGHGNVALITTGAAQGMPNSTNGLDMAFEYQWSRDPHASTDRTGNSRASQRAITVGILRKILLMVILR